MEIDGDGNGPGPPPSPDDRIWRHPSELFGVGAFVDEPRRTPRPRRSLRSAAIVVFVTAIAGIVLTDTFEEQSDPARRRAAGSGLTVPLGLSGGASESPGVLEVRVRRDRTWQIGTATVFPGDGGYAVTTGRVVDGADEILAVVGRGDLRPVRVLGTDDHADIAVLEVGDGVGRSMRWSAPTLGSLVAVIGATNGETDTAGTVQDIDVRERTSTGAPIDGMLLTDVPVRPEMSGGAVVNEAGDVVGLVNAMPFAGSGHAPGTEAVRADVVALIAGQIIAEGSARHAWLGIGVTEPDQDNDADGSGVLVTQVDPRGPAAIAGISEGDQILAVDDSQVTSIPTLMAALRQRRPGDVVSLLVGPGRPERIAVKLGSGPPEE